MKRRRSEQATKALDRGVPNPLASADEAAPPRPPPQLQHEQVLAPHTLRLLRLILEGTVEHAAEASGHLVSIAAQQSSPMQLWDIMGRLHEGLTSNHWKTRTQAADALQGVARRLPLSDHRQFLCGIVDEGTQQSFLTIQDLMGGALETVLARGLPLYATARDRFIDDEALQGLDRNALESEHERAQFLQRRMKLQRDILAQRLGLAGIGDVLGYDAVLPSSIGASDMMLDQESLVAKRQRHADLRGPPTVTHTNDPHSVRALLVMEMQRQERATGATSHRNPQQLLATELVYRMFDPAWHVRHGAVLGTLSLLRAWKAHVNNFIFGTWPLDVLARCLCILGLDRFGDFSGALISTDSKSTGGVVSPVREVTGQLVSVLFAMAPRSVQNDTLDLLFLLCEFDEEWEPRHGAFATLKFILVVLRSSRDDDDGWTDAVAEKMALVAVRRLCDSSDDVASAAALVVTEYLVASEAIPEFILAASSSVLQSSRDARSVSSSVIDMVELLTEMLRIDARAVVASLSRSNSVADNIHHLSEVLVDLLDSDYDSVRTSTIHSISAFVTLLRSFSEEENNSVDDGLYQETAKVCSRLITKLFEWYFPEESPEHDGQKCLYVLFDLLWKDLTTLANLLKRRACAEITNLEICLIRRYFWIGESILSQSDTPIYSKASSALAAFLITDDHGPSLRSLIAVASLLESPWIYHCESSCLLFKSFYNHVEKVCPLDLARIPLLSMLEKPPMCLLASQADGFTMDKQFHDLCKSLFCSEIANFSAKNESPSAVVNRLSNAWTAMLQTRGLTRSATFSKVASMNTMRVESLIAGAVATSGLPTKITPVVRGLMTSLNNECNSATRQNHTCTDLSLLLRQLDQKPMYAVAFSKVFSKICDLAVGERPDDATINLNSSGMAARVLRSVSRSSTVASLREMKPLWSRITKLVAGNMHDPALLSAAKLLRIVTDSLDETSPLLCYVIDTFTVALVRCSCEPEAAMKNESCATLLTLCSLDAHHLLLTALPVIIELVGQQHDNSLRFSACMLLKDLVDKSATSITCFVRVLLPVVMALMTDRNQECSMKANSLFAALVRIAPLVRSDASQSGLKVAGFDSRCENVIDHLIFGLPLPPYKLPRDIDAALKAGGIQLRAYQMEGIAWLRFLQTVKLNGALCDSMGLGKTLQALVAMAIAHGDDENESGAPISLVVCPSSIVGHWVQEIKKFFPGKHVFQPMSYTGPLSTRVALRTHFKSQYNIVVTSYSVLRSDISILKDFEWRCCVLDEGHLLKNPRTGETGCTVLVRRATMLLTYFLYDSYGAGLQAVASNSQIHFDGNPCAE
jgi:hypothetical protein